MSQDPTNDESKDQTPVGEASRQDPSVAAPAAESGAKALNRPGEDTPPAGENQGVQGLSAPEPATWEDLVERKAREVEALFTEKEALKLTLVDSDTPMAYYERWRGEANKIFSQLVRMRRRIAEETPKGSAGPAKTGQKSA